MFLINDLVQKQHCILLVRRGTFAERKMLINGAGQHSSGLHKLGNEGVGSSADTACIAQPSTPVKCRFARYFCRLTSDHPHAPN